MYRGFDLILEPYRVAPKASIRDCTLLVPAGSKPGNHIDEDEGQQLFIYAETIAFAGLATRDYFGFKYWSRENFRLVIQQYSEPSTSTSYQTRRRDGSSTVLASSHLVLRPDHVSISSPVKLDEDSLQILSTTTDLPDWDRIYEAVLHFNTANTDSHTLTHAIELVLMVSAFERLFSVSSGKCEPLIQAVDTALSPAERVPKGSSKRVPSDLWDSRFGKRDSLTAVWVQDLCALRGTVAHGVVIS